jgi:hypothetical protein
VAIVEQAVIDREESMSEPRRTSGRAPWITAGVLGVIAALLAVAVFVLIPSSKRHDRASGSPGALTSDQQHAVTAAATEAVNVLSFSRKTFAADFARALAGTTGALKSDLEGKKATTLSTMTSGKIDLHATVAQSAYEGTDSSTHHILVLVTVNGFNTNDQGVSTAPTPQRLEMTMNKVGSKWLASDIESVGIDG